MKLAYDVFLQWSIVKFVEVHYLIAKKTLDEVLFHTLEKKTLSVGPQLVAMEAWMLRAWWSHQSTGLQGIFCFNSVWIPFALKKTIQYLLKYHHADIAAWHRLIIIILYILFVNNRRTSSFSWKYSDDGQFFWCIVHTHTYIYIHIYDMSYFYQYSVTLQTIFSLLWSIWTVEFTFRSFVPSQNFTWAMKKNPGRLGCVGILLPSFVGIIKNSNKYINHEIKGSLLNNPNKQFFFFVAHLNFTVQGTTTILNGQSCGLDVSSYPWIWGWWDGGMVVDNLDPIGWWCVSLVLQAA